MISCKLVLFIHTQEVDEKKKIVYTPPNWICQPIQINIIILKKNGEQINFILLLLFVLPSNIYMPK